MENAVKINRRYMLALAGIGIVSPFLGGKAGATSGRSSWVPGPAELEALKSAMTQYDVAGAQIAVIEDGDVAWRSSYGVLNIQTGKPVQDDTLFQGGSLSKPLFAHVVMRLIEEGRLKLDDRLTDFYRPDGYIYSDWTEHVTVKHVLAHQTGLPNWRPKDKDNDIEPEFAPGTQHSYSGEAFYWLQQVCEKITGLSLHQQVNDYVFKPGDLSNMAMNWLPENDYREVYGHVVSESGNTVLSQSQFTREHGRHLQKISDRWGRPLTEWRSSDLRAAHAIMPMHEAKALSDRPMWRWQQPSSAIINSAYTLRTTASDYASFLCSMFLGSEKPSWHLDKSSINKMLTPQTERAGRLSSRPIGLGWFLERWENDTYFGHVGISGSRHICLAFADPKRKRGLVIMTNCESGGQFVINMAILLAGTKFKTFN